MVSSLPWSATLCVFWSPAVWLSALSAWFWSSSASGVVPFADPQTLTPNTPSFKKQNICLFQTVCNPGHSSLAHYFCGCSTWNWAKACAGVCAPREGEWSCFTLLPMVHPHAQLAWISTPPGDRPLHTTVREFLDRANWSGKNHLKCG